MMQPIMFDYILKGATKGELVAIQRILDRNKELCIPNEFCENGGKVFSSEYFEVPDKGDYFVFDLSKEGIIRLKCDSRVGIIYYDIPDRDRVLEQLVLMISGYKILDCDYSEIIDILKKGCVFKWVRFGGSYDKAIYDINMALKSVKNKVVASYF
ncbi:MAG: hypothetical protein K6F17_00030 [Lachnospiraceae bacterium]|nr:hypothetical protein [Lachnospiraceae bacterium]